MDLPPLSLDQLSAVLAADSTPADLYTTLSDYEDEACLIPTTSPTERDLLIEFYTSFFFAHLITDQICEARALTRRIPRELLQADSLQNCQLLLRAAWQNKHAEIYKILRELPWPERSQPLVQCYENYFQEKTLKEVSTSFDSIRIAAAATYLGLDSAAAEKGDPTIIDKFTALGWKWESEKGLLHPKPIVTAPPKSDSLQNELSQVMALISNQTS
ncbi:CSN8/PSMD8/EIF3K family protein [Aspergillus stella-maris]|uniref:CSN8/PSMD8/EIF3K family protein n=1 Tax=Aspergillus stella-maris TaxID=1810926 RepID=UPI003CCDC649